MKVSTRVTSTKEAFNANDLNSWGFGGILE